LSHWVLGLCMPEERVVDTDPSYDDFNTDPATGITGMKWESTGGTFTVTFDTIYPIGTTPVGVKSGSGSGGGGDNEDDKVDTGEIAGPHCGDGEPSETTVQFGNYHLGKILAHKFEDLNADGHKQYGTEPEPGLQGWEMTLYDAVGNELGTNETGPNGWATFRDLETGTYTVCETPQDDWINSKPGDDTVVDPEELGRPCYEVTLEGSQAQEIVTFGNYQKGSITIIKDAPGKSGYVFDFGGDLGDFSLSSGQSYSSDDLIPGEYTVFEYPASMPKSWWLANVICDTDPSASAGAGSVEIDWNNASATITLASNQHITCTFYNERAGFEEDTPTFKVFLPLTFRP